MVFCAVKFLNFRLEKKFFTRITKQASVKLPVISPDNAIKYNEPLIFNKPLLMYLIGKVVIF